MAAVSFANSVCERFNQMTSDLPHVRLRTKFSFGSPGADIVLHINKGPGEVIAHIQDAGATLKNMRQVRRFIDRESEGEDLWGELHSLLREVNQVILGYSSGKKVVETTINLKINGLPIMIVLVPQEARAVNLLHWEAYTIAEYPKRIASGVTDGSLPISGGTREEIKDMVTISLIKRDNNN